MFHRIACGPLGSCSRCSRRGGDQPVDQVEHRREREHWGEVEHPVVRHQPQARDHQLCADVGEGGKDAVGSPAEPAVAGRRTARPSDTRLASAPERLQGRSRGEELAEQQAAGEHAQQRHPHRLRQPQRASTTRVTDVGQPRL